ncbi:hypothetical protein F2Q70_00024618 [Brassica cretica]|uniref:Uncharacterized protein n=1 Tax=Brassica cretica TaxID=69181 RepID=A0A8S9LCD1_BRACR|nr:hypothetical protein F2Q70_00024618 [Brassica cretica]
MEKGRKNGVQGQLSWARETRASIIGPERGDALFPGNGGSTAPVSPAFVPGKAVTLIALSFRRRLLRFVPELVPDLRFWVFYVQSTLDLKIVWIFWIDRR